ncbi:MAG: glycoside hydrolase family 3 C-terminal domain-containing protein [Deltaproteobacteria bacterium]|nr:glycoside hydrolase family 3 C-terminal domain-containing protein [Deltaproteobacteria bacterium]
MNRHAPARSLMLCAALALAPFSLVCTGGVRPLHEIADAGPTSDGGTVDAGPTCLDATVAAANLPCDGDADVAKAKALLASMSLDEKVQQMSGPAYNPNNMFDQADNTRLQIPGHKYMDGPRGVRWYNTDYGTTVYPVPEARAASWDPELERLIGKAMAKEMRYLGRHILNAPTINQVMHPRWGRAQESYGEDTHMLGVMGAALVTGIQYDPHVDDPKDPDNVIEDTYRVEACVKHFAANNIEDQRIFVNAVVDERTLREVYLPHFKKAIDAGASCVMASYNRVNNDYSCYNTPLLHDILKGEWNYSGFVISDWFAKGKTVQSVGAGLDVEMPFSSGAFPSLFDSAYFYGTLLSSAVTAGQVDVKLVDEAVLRILYRKVHFGLIAHAPVFTPWLTKSDATQALALRAAREGIVLLKNGPTDALSDDVLPLDRAALHKIAVVGKFANAENMGDKGSSDAKVVDGTLVINPFEGIRDAFVDTGKTAVTFTTVAGNESSIGSSDVVVIVAAYQYADLARTSSGEEGEWKDRVSLALPQRDLDNINAAIALKSAHPNLKIVVVTKSGGAVLVKDWIGSVDAHLHAWYAGMAEGTALAEILFGDTNPSGHLVQSFPVNESDLPAFQNTTQGDVNYNYFHGYRWLEKKGIAPQYWFGYGQSYTTFAFSNLQVANATIPATGTLSVSVDVKNTGPVAGSTVAQLYVGFDNTQVPGGPDGTNGWGRPVKQLFGFARVADLAPNETRTVTINVDASELGYWDTSAKKFIVEKMVHQLYVGPTANPNDPNMKKSSFTIQ